MHWSIFQEKSNLERSDPLIMYYSEVFTQVVSSFLIPFLHLQFERTYVLYVAPAFPGSANSDGCCASSKTIQTDDQRHPRWNSRVSRTFHLSYPVTRSPTRVKVILNLNVFCTYRNNNSNWPPGPNSSTRNRSGLAKVCQCVCSGGLVLDRRNN